MPEKTDNLKGAPTPVKIEGLEKAPVEQNSDAWAGSHTINQSIVELQSREYKLNQPIQVRIQPYRHGFLVADDDIARYGAGDTIHDAICDYQNQLIDYFRCLNEHYPRLSPKLMEDLTRLNQIISKV